MPAKGKPKPLSVRTAEVNLDGEYENWWFLVRLNPPFEVWEQIASGEFRNLREGFATIIREWNAVDEQGEPIGPPGEDTIGKLPLDLLNILAEKYTALVTALPKQ